MTAAPQVGGEHKEAKMRKVLMVLVGALVVLAGCGDGPTEPDDGGVQCFFDGNDGDMECYEG